MGPADGLFSLGCSVQRQGGEAVDDVALPPWARGCAHRFVRMHREALEVPFASSDLCRARLACLRGLPLQALVRAQAPPRREAMRCFSADAMPRLCASCAAGWLGVISAPVGVES